MVSVSNTSGEIAGIAHWINTYYKLPDERKVGKDCELVAAVKIWVDEQYDDGRVTVMTDEEMVQKITEICREKEIIL